MEKGLRGMTVISFLFFAAVSKELQCSEQIAVCGGFNIKNTELHALHNSWSFHPKGFDVNEHERS